MAIDQLRYPVRPRRGERRCRPRANQHRLETVRPHRAPRGSSPTSVHPRYTSPACAVRPPTTRPRRPTAGGHRRFTFAIAIPLRPRRRADGESPALPQGEHRLDHHNQAGYARQAFDSFLDQQTDFPVEIIVADDASTDATPAIIREYAERYPHVFRPIFRTENLGLNGNLTGALSAARGEYVALCEADDYWIDPLKLSKQVAFLDRHPKTTVCFHPVRVIWEDGHAKDSKFPRFGCGAT